MDSSYAIIRRFTPPTCTLEILGKKSLLSRWSNKIVLKDARFKLSFDDPKILEEEPVVIKGDRQELDTLYNSVLDYTGRFLSQSFISKNQDIVAKQQEDNGSPLVSLTPKNLVSHQLSLTNLNGESQAKPIELSATQLFDLVTALEDYKTEMLVLIELETQQQQKSPKIFPIGWSVAGIILAVGLATTTLKLTKNKELEESVAVNSPETTTPAKIVTPEVLAPQIPESKHNSSPDLQESEALSSSEILPPPPSVSTPKPPPNIPDPALYPPTGNLQIPPIEPFPTLKQPNSEEQVVARSPGNIGNQNTQVESNIVIPPQPSAQQPLVEQQIPTEIAKSQTEIAITTNSQNGTSLQEAPNGARSDRSSSADTSNGTTLAKPNSPTAIDPDSKISQIPQQAEIESYLQQKWQPPASLNKTLEYRLFLAQDGSLARVMALGKISGIFLDRTGIPLKGESFVSPLENQDSAIIRLLLSPDGEIKTFVE